MWKPALINEGLRHLARTIIFFCKNSMWKPALINEGLRPGVYEIPSSNLIDCGNLPSLTRDCDWGIQDINLTHGTPPFTLWKPALINEGLRHKAVDYLFTLEETSGNLP